jgi:hypothetical protein
MDYKKHPIFDRSAAADWLDVSEYASPMTPERERCAKLIEAYDELEEQLADKVLRRIKLDAADDLASRPHVERGDEPLLAPIGDHGFQVYFKFYFSESADEASADNDFWWGIIACEYVLGPSARAHMEYWNVVHFGYSVE